MRVVRQRQPRQRVFFQRIRSALQHDRLGPQPGDEREDGRGKKKTELGIVETARHWQIACCPAAAIARGAAARPAPGFMDADGENPIVVEKSFLDAVAVMGVDIEINDRRDAGIAPGKEAKHGVVEIAKSRGPRRAPVMRAATRAMDDTARFRQPRRQQHAAGRGRGAAENLRIDRVAIGADAKPRAIGLAYALACLGALEGGEVGGVVKPGKRRDARLRRLAIDRLGQPAERPAKIGAA